MKSGPKWPLDKELIMGLSKSVLGIVGYGVMGQAITRCFERSEELQERFCLKVLARTRPEYCGGNQALSFVSSFEEIAAQSETIIIAVRSEQVIQTVAELARNLPGQVPDKSKLVISLATGVPVPSLDEAGGGKFAIARIMPNVLLEVNRGVFGFCHEMGLPNRHYETIRFLFDRLGLVIEIDENQMNIVTALAGCGPAFMFYLMDAFIEAGASIGLTRETARQITIGLMGGCAELASNTCLHPVILREQGGSSGMTITGMNRLDSLAVRGHIIDGIKTAYEHGKIMDREIGSEKGIDK